MQCIFIRILRPTILTHFGLQEFNYIFFLYFCSDKVWQNMFIIQIIPLRTLWILFQTKYIDGILYKSPRDISKKFVQRKNNISFHREGKMQHGKKYNYRTNKPNFIKTINFIKNFAQYESHICRIHIENVMQQQNCIRNERDMPNYSSFQLR